MHKSKDFRRFPTKGQPVNKGKGPTPKVFFIQRLHCRDTLRTELSAQTITTVSLWYSQFKLSLYRYIIAHTIINHITVSFKPVLSILSTLNSSDCLG